MVIGVIVQNLFDASGRRIPPPGIGAAVNPADSRYTLVQPRIDYAEIHARLTDHIGPTGLSSTEFADRAESVLALLRGSDETAPLASGVRVPFALGRARHADIGRALEEEYLPALGRAWKARFPKSDFKNEIKGGMAGKATIAKGSRYERLVDAMAEASLVGYYFPLALSGFSFAASLRQMADLPDTFVLSGGYEACAALTGCPDLIVNPSAYPPQLDLASLEAPAAGYGYHFAPYASSLTFNGRFHIDQASDYCSSGLTVLALSRKQK
jgi:hypothetical protein